ncbi:MAG: HDOD domain-containing protein [Defluviitaleaceae bacterium]|nr:HDOD domain-containing protein [Defluviitaleaceae bacterium]
MKLLIVPKPVLSSDLAVMSYCFRYQRGGEYLADQYQARLLDGIVNLPCLTVLEDVGLDGFTNGEPLFVPINHFTLLADVTRQCSQPPEKIIFLLDSHIPVEPLFIDCITKLKDLGFRFAVEDVKNYDTMKPIIELCDFIFISFKYNTEQSGTPYQAVMKKFPKLTFIASEVNDIEVFKKIRNVGFSFFEGRFYNLPLTYGQNTIAPIKVNRIQLINLVREEDFAIEEIVKIVGQDTALTISLLQLVNSPYLGLSQKISSLQQAGALLGQNELRKWVTTATTELLSEDRPDELTRLSLIRAKFAENLATSFEMGIHAQSLFLMGLFSVLDVVLEMPMEEALKVIVVSKDIHEALVAGTGSFFPILNFMMAYESAQWSEVNRLMALHNLDIERVFASYIETIRWYSSITSLVVEEEQR